jgi:hypothetical protein
MILTSCVPARAAFAAALAAAAMGVLAQNAERPRPPATAQSIQQKALLLDKVLASSSLAARVAASQSELAQQHVANARELVGHARTLAASGELAVADALLNQAIGEVSRAQRLAPEPAPAQAAEGARYSQLLKEAAAPLAGQTLVVQRRFATAREEYDFELERHRSFERLVPLAVAQLRPAPPQLQLVDRYVADARRLRERAEAAAPLDAAAAVRFVAEGTDHLRRALQAAGLVIPQSMGAP